MELDMPIMVKCGLWHERVYSEPSRAC